MFFPVLPCGSMVRSRLAVCLWRRLHQWRAWLDWVRAAVYDCARFAGVAQLVEQRIRNAKVGSSTLFTGTKFQKATLAVAFCFSGPAKVLPQVDTCALLLGPESMARLEMDRRPSPNYQINHNLIFATAIHSQHINHTLIFKPTPPEQHDQSQLNFPVDHQLIN